MSDTQETETAEDHRPRLRLRWLWLLALTVAAAPSVLTLADCHQKLLKILWPELGDATAFTSGTTHWWSPVEFSNVTIADLTADRANPVPVISAGRISTAQPLWKLMLSLGRGAQIVIEDPVVDLHVIDGTTNLERTLAKLSGPHTRKAEPFRAAITVSNGVIRLMPDSQHTPTDGAVGTMITGINGTLSTLRAGALPELTLVADITAGQTARVAGGLPRQQGVDPRIAAKLDELTGDFPLIPFTEQEMQALGDDNATHTLTAQMAPSAEDTGTSRISIEVRQLNLAEIDPVLRRFLPGFICRGDVSCRLQAHVLGTDGESGMAGRLQLLAEDIHVRNVNWTAGESIHFDSLTTQGAAAVADDGILVRHLRVNSAILDLNGDGEVQLASAESASGAEPSGKVQLNGRIDIAALTRMLPQTLQLASNVEVQTADLKFFGQVSNPAADRTKSRLPGRSPGFQWQAALESSVIDAVRNSQTLKLDSPVRLEAAGQCGVHSVSLEQARVTGGFGQLSVNPLETGFDISGRINPDVLWKDLRQIVDVPSPGLKGDVDVRAKLNMPPGEIRVSDLQLKSKSVVAKSHQLTIRPNRPLLQMFDGQISIEGYGSAVKTIASPWHKAAWLSDDTIVAAALTADPSQVISLTATVRPTGRAAARTDDGCVVDEGRLEASLFADAEHNGFVVDRGSVSIPGLVAAVRGTLTIVDGIVLTNLTADTKYDLSVLSEQLLGRNVRNVRLTGSGQETLHISGAPEFATTEDIERYFSRSPAAAQPADEIVPLMVTGRVAWTGGRVYDLPLGHGIASVQLKDGLLRAEPIQCTLGSGTVNVMPAWNLYSGHVRLASGSRIENLELTPDLCGKWLGYVAPVLSDAASVSGTLACRVHSFDYFPERPQQSDVRAILTLHNATAAPGESMMPLLQVVEAVGRRQLTSRQIEFPAQDIPVEMRDGMVLHNGLQFGIAGYDVSSSGGVGLNGIVQLALDIPLERSTASQRGRTIRLPVRGTIDRPRIDTQGLLQNLGRQQIQERVNEQIDRGLNKLLDKLR